MAERAAPGGFLATMAAASRERAEALHLRWTAGDLRARLAGVPVAPRLALDERFDLVAEFKRRAPSAGDLARDGHDPVRHAAACARAGAAAVSVLTEPDRFAGSLDDLAAVARAVAVPAMRKDFLVDPIQLSEARLAGAAGALVVVAIVDDGTLAALDERARELGMFLLLEAFDERDLDRIDALLATHGRTDRLVGVNARDLRDLSVDTARLARLAPRARATGVPAVAESGLTGPGDAARAAALGYRAALVGGALMRVGDPVPLVRAMIASGRAAAERC